MTGDKGIIAMAGRTIKVSGRIIELDESRLLK